MGAIGEGGVKVVEDSVVSATRLGISTDRSVERRERAVLDARIAQYRQWRPAVPLEGRSAVIVDDGIATGATVRAACQVVASRGRLEGDRGGTSCDPGGDRGESGQCATGDLPPDSGPVWSDRAVLRRLLPGRRRRGEADPHRPRGRHDGPADTGPVRIMS